MSKASPQSGSPFARSIDAEVLRRARHGDTGAHARLYEDFSGPVYTLSLRLLAEPAAAEDVTQEVFLKVMRRIRRFRGDAPVGFWIRRMAVNACMDRLRRRRFESPADIDEVMAYIQASNPMMDEQIEAMQLLLRLPARERAMLVLHEVEGYTHAELGDLFSRSESYSKSALSRAMGRLRTTLGRDAGPGDKGGNRS